MRLGWETKKMNEGIQSFIHHLDHLQPESRMPLASKATLVGFQVEVIKVLDCESFLQETTTKINMFVVVFLKKRTRNPGV